jgi:hypothetical protein
MSDAAEFEAQTDPKQASSNLRVISVEVVTANDVALRWASIPGRTYRVQARWKFDPENQWLDVSDPFVASTTVSEFTLPGAGVAELYLRIITSD